MLFDNVQILYAGGRHFLEPVNIYMRMSNREILISCESSFKFLYIYIYNLMEDFQVKLKLRSLELHSAS